MADTFLPETVTARYRCATAVELIEALTSMVSPDDTVLIEDAPLIVELVEKKLSDGSPVHDIRVYRQRNC